MQKRDTIRNFTQWLNILLIPIQFRDSPILSRKARILSYIHIFLIFFVLVFDVSNTLSGVEGPPLKIALVIAVSLLILFRWKGNFNLSGNLLALFFFAVQADAVYKTGGLYSDNLLWMLCSPLLALLFANPASGLFWLAALLGFTGHLYFVEINAEVSYRAQLEGLDAMYFMTTYMGLFAIVVGIVLIFATGQRLIFNALNEKQRELSEQKAELARQAESLRKAQVQLKAINEELEQFAYAASHDLKEPLRMIKMYTQFIEKKLSSSLDESTTEYMGFVTDGVARMEKLLTDLLEYSRLGRNKREVNDTNLNEILFLVVNNMTATMQDTKASISANELPVIQATSTEMIQLFQNLISNAIKFRQKDRDPEVEVWYEKENEYHHLSIADNGIGISEENCHKVFKIFERLHSRTEYEGTGIGLATCKKIVDHMEGRIWVEPGKEKGTVFHLSFPANG